MSRCGSWLWGVFFGVSCLIRWSGWVNLMLNGVHVEGGVSY